MNFKNTMKSVSLLRHCEQSEAIQKNTVISLGGEECLYKKAVKEERSDGICLRYKYPKRKEKKYGLPRSPKRLPRNDETSFFHFVIARNKVTKQSRAAFSLVEMLMALLVASLLLAALAPVMTRKINDNVNLSGNTSKGANYTPCIPIGGSCTVPLDVNIAGAIILSAGGGGGGAVPDKTSTIQTSLGNITGTDNASSNTTYQTNTYQITENMKDLEITLISGGGGGGGANGTITNNTPTKQSDCEPFGVYVSASQNGGKAVCVSKYNPGENRDGSPSIPASVISIPANGTTSCTGESCCWYGNNAGGYKTSSTCDASVNGITYSGCYRTVCNWNAATAICSNWKPIKEKSSIAGRLPAYEELTAWKNSNALSDTGKLNWDTTVTTTESPNGSGLLLCLDSTKFPRCSGLTQKCKGAGKGTVYENSCRPNFVWGSQNQSANNSCWAFISSNKIGGYECSNAFTTRCVLETVSSQKLYTGGGGGAGIYARINVPNEVLERAVSSTGKATLTLQAGSGGKGGSAKNTSRGISGSSSIAKITDNNNALIWYFEIPGGQGGAGASSTSGGAFGGAGNTSQCKYLDITNHNYSTLKTGTCSSFPLANVSIGEAGGKGDISTAYSTAGYGGRPMIENTFQGSRPQTPSGVNITAINGGNAGSAGSGGAGGNCYNNNDTLSCGIGGYGKGGRVQAKYKKYTPGAAGGGGGAGTLVHIRNISVKAGDEVNLSIGKGGAGGTSGVNGANGGSSYVIISGTKFEIAGGGGGKAATAGNPDTNIIALSGGAGMASSITNTTKNLLSGLSSSNYNIYPKDTMITAGSAAPSPALSNGRIWTQSAGGNGGINEATFTQSTYPCGGLSILTDNCNNISVSPLAPAAKEGKEPPDYFDEKLIKQYPAGATGGGGGGWMKGSGAAGGANGMDGYVYVYFSGGGI